MAKTPAPKKNGSSKKNEPPSRSGRAKWLLLAAVLLTAFLYWILQQAPDVKKTPQLPGRFPVEKTESGGNVDYTASTQKMHPVVDKAISELKGVRKDLKESRREVPRAAGGSIRWHNRQLVVSLPPEANKDAVEKLLSNSLKEVGGEVLAAESDRYQGGPAFRLDLGYRDTLAGEPVIIVADRLYLVWDKGAEPGIVPERKQTFRKGKR